MNLTRFENPHFVNTSEAYSNSVFIGSSNVVIPYINIDLMPDNPITKEQTFINYSYFVFEEVKTVLLETEGGHMLLDFNHYSNEEHISEWIQIGGFKSQKGAEVKIECKRSVLYFSNNIEFRREEHFLPVNTPLHSCNMVLEEVNNFFSFSYLPHNIKEGLGKDVKIFKLW